MSLVLKKVLMMGLIADYCFSRRTLATTTTMYRHENGRTYHAYRTCGSVSLSIDRATKS